MKIRITIEREISKDDFWGWMDTMKVQNEKINGHKLQTDRKITIEEPNKIITYEILED